MKNRETEKLQQKLAESESIQRRNIEEREQLDVAIEGRTEYTLTLRRDLEKAERGSPNVIYCNAVPYVRMMTEEQANILVTKIFRKCPTNETAIQAMIDAGIIIECDQ